jgi:hypothetical protein
MPAHDSPYRLAVITIGTRDGVEMTSTLKGNDHLQTATVDQILGYASWRDTRTAIFMFNRQRDLSKVLPQIVPTVKTHPRFIREIPYGDETSFRFVLSHRDDAERELTLTIFVYEIPT